MGERVDWEEGCRSGKRAVSGNDFHNYSTWGATHRRLSAGAEWPGLCRRSLVHLPLTRLYCRRPLRRHLLPPPTKCNEGALTSAGTSTCSLSRGLPREGETAEQTGARWRVGPAAVVPAGAAAVADVLQVSRVISGTEARPRACRPFANGLLAVVASAGVAVASVRSDTATATPAARGGAAGVADASLAAAFVGVVGGGAVAGGAAFAIAGGAVIGGGGLALGQGGWRLP